MISAQLPRSTIIFFTSYPLILKVTTKVSLCGWMVPNLSSSEKLSDGQNSILSLFGSELESSYRHHPRRVRTSSPWCSKNDIDRT